MDLVLRRCFWMVDLAFLAGAAFLCALTASALAAHPSLLPTLPEMRSAHAFVSRPVLDAQAVSRATGLPLELEAPLPAAELLERTSLSVRLLGTSVSNLPAFSLATLQDKNSRATDVFAVGDALQGATVVSIERLRVVVDNHGRRETIGLEGSLADQPTATASGLALAPVPGIVAIDATHFIIDRPFLLGIAQNPGVEMGKMLVTPAIQGGSTIGWKLSRLAPDALLAKLGLGQGDVFRRVNGFELSDPAKILEVLGRLTSASQVQVEIDRSGAAQRLDYRIRD
jgi:general secretion pathway protein C